MKNIAELVAFLWVWCSSLLFRPAQLICYLSLMSIRQLFVVPCKYRRMGVLTRVGEVSSRVLISKARRARVLKAMAWAWVIQARVEARVTARDIWYRKDTSNSQVGETARGTRQYLVPRHLDTFYFIFKDIFSSQVFKIAMFKCLDLPMFHKAHKWDSSKLNSTI